MDRDIPCSAAFRSHTPDEDLLEDVHAWNFRGGHPSEALTFRMQLRAHSQGISTVHSDGLVLMGLL